MGQAEEALRPVAGVTDLLDALRTINLRLAIASSSSRDMIELAMNKADLASYFEAVTNGNEVTQGKPDPEIFLVSAEKLGVPPEECIVIEDSPHGISGGKAAGMTCIGFKNPNSGDQDLSNADLTVNDFSAESIECIIKLATSPGRS